ncbi:MAG: N-acetyltransferase family protein [Rhodothermaceae bacterium]
MEEKLIIRKAAFEDAETIIRFNINMAKETEDKDLPYEKISPGVKGLFSKPEYGFYIVAEVDGEIAASLMITYEWTDWRNGIFWWIQSVYVEEKFRRKGIYSKMYQWVKEQVEKEEGVFGFRLYVEKENIAAQKTYEALGMKETVYKLYEEPLAK